MEASTAATGVRRLALEGLQNPTDQERPGPHPLGVSLAGPFRSFFEDRKIPPLPAQTLVGQPAAEEEPIAQGQDARLVVVGSADFIANNLTFVLNAVDWLVQDPALMSIRAKTAAAHALEAPERGAASRINLATLGVPLLVLWAGGAVVAFRARAKRGAA
jgi:hypothetical protein